MELAGDKVLDLAGVRRIDKGQAVDLGVVRGGGASAVGDRGFADDEGEGEDQLVVAAELQQKGGPTSAARGFWVLEGGCQLPGQRDGR
jgi:hypothetical protein